MQTSGATKFNAASPAPTAARDEAINEAVQDALNDGDGRPRPDALAIHLAKRGLVIVEASKYSGMLIALQLLASTGSLVAQVVLKKVDAQL